MISIIEKIYKSERGCYESLDRGERYKKALQKVIDLHYKFEEILNDEQKELFEDFIYHTDDLELEAGLANFKEGFKVGLLIGMEVIE